MPVSPAPPAPDSDAPPRFGMIHGRFQPFHNGHWDYCRLALERCRTLIIGITNPDPSQIAREPSADHRHRADANPFSFFDRQRMIRAALRDAGVPFERVIFIPFPVNTPERWPAYVPDDAVHFVRVFSDWEQTKVDRLRAAGYTVEVLTPGADKTIDATEVRRRLRAGRGLARARPGGRGARPGGGRRGCRGRDGGRARGGRDVSLRVLLIIFDGLGDRPAPELGGKTPLEAARTPNLDRLAREGVTGTLHAKSPGYPLGSPIALHLLFGYPEEEFPDRGPLIARARGYDLPPGDVMLSARFACADVEGTRLRLRQRFITDREEACAALAEAIAEYTQRRDPLSLPLQRRRRRHPVRLRPGVVPRHRQRPAGAGPAGAARPAPARGRRRPRRPRHRRRAQRLPELGPIARCATIPPRPKAAPPSTP